MVKFRELTKKGRELAEMLVSDKPKYGTQISLPTGFTFQALLREMENPAGKRRIEFFEILCGRKIIGFCYYTVYERYRAAELATIFMPGYRGKGLVSPTIRFLINHATRTYPQLLRVEATASSANPKAIASLLSAGFNVEGVRPAGYVRGNKISDAVLLGVVLKRDDMAPSSMYQIESFRDKTLERKRLLKQGEILLDQEAELIRNTGLQEKFSKAERIVDIGCGFGQFAAWLSKAFPETDKIFGVDPSRWMIRASEASGNRKVKLVCSDGLKFLDALPAGGTEAVCMRFVINHIPERLWGRWLTAARRCLKPGGFIYLTLSDANYYKTFPGLPLMDLLFSHKKLLREKNGGVWNVPAVIGGHLYAAGFRNITQKSTCLSTEKMGKQNYASSVGDQFVWGVEESWGRTGELARKSLIDAAKAQNFWGQVKFGIHIGEKA